MAFTIIGMIPTARIYLQKDLKLHLIQDAFL